MKRQFLTSALTVVLTFAALAGYRALAGEGQPNMREALHHLQEAKESLDKATANKGGHREKALELTQKAIEEVKAGIQFADQK
jgi:hypothetical protein